MSLAADFVEPIRVVLRAFNGTRTDSRLLFTSRFPFTLPDGTADLVQRLHDMPLHGMDRHEAGKQATAKLRLQAEDAGRRQQKIAALVARLDDIIAAAQGNPGLQDILFTLGLEDPDACDRCLKEMGEFRAAGELPREDEARQFIENLALQTLLVLLTPEQGELLRASTLFDLPVPAAAMERLGRAGSSDFPRLIALGLWEVYQDLHRPHEQALAINALVRPLAGGLSDAEGRALAAAVSTTLFEKWGSEKGGRERGYMQDHELTRLALLAREARVLASTAADALRFLERQFSYRQAAAWARGSPTPSGPSPRLS